MAKRRRMEAMAYRGGYIRPTPHGTWRADRCAGGRRWQRSFPADDLDGARRWLDQIEIDLANQDRPLSYLEYADARAALDLLPETVSLLDAARAYLRLHRPPERIRLADAAEAFVLDRDRAGRRLATVLGYQYHLRRFAGDHPGLHADEVTPAQVGAWADALPVSASTRDSYRRTLRAFFEWAKRRGYFHGPNPAEAITVPRSDERPVRILAVGQAARLLRAAQIAHPELCPWLAVGLFAGVRHSESERLTAADFAGDHIRIRAASKSRRARYVTIPPVLRAWLGACPVGETLSPVKIKARGKRLSLVRAAAGCLPWPPNALRHSYATYHLALHRDAAALRHELGHETADVLYRHYVHVVTPDQAEAYFALRPAAVKRWPLCSDRARPAPTSCHDST